MEQHITADRIANSIMQESKFADGIYLLVEGAKDIRVYNRLFKKENVRIRQTYGKYKQRDVYEILSKRGFESKICIRDADFLRVIGNKKFVIDFSDNIFATDGHDSEVMMASSEALDNLLSIVSTDEKIKAFEEKLKIDIRSLVFELAKPIGYLRYANKQYNLGLSFKPKRPDGNCIKFKKFICEKEFISLGPEKLINTVYEYSKAFNDGVEAREVILEKFRKVSNLNIPIIELVNGHDFSEILSIVIKKGLKSESGLVQDKNSVESSLALAYELRYFHRSNLYAAIKKWAEEKNFDVI